MNCICENEFNVDCEYCNQLGMSECYHGILLDFIQCQCDECKEGEE